MNPETVGTFEHIIRIALEGGLIAVCAAIGIAIVIDRFVFLNKVKSSNKKAFEAMMPLMKKRDFDGLVKMAADPKAAPICKIIGAGALRLKVTQDREDISYAMEEGVMEITPRLQKRTNYLATLANLSTLLGLLGTIVGLIQAFAAVANAVPAEKASMLSASVALAMNATAGGLSTAIPLLVFHAVLSTKTIEIVDSLEMAGVKFLNSLVD
jgi:biopolymer transport protein ExbB/TolQ